VKHHVAPRKGSDQNHRGGFSSDALFEEAHNEAYVFHSRLRGCKLFMIATYALLVGTKQTFGCLQWLRAVIKGDATANARFLTTRQGHRAGKQTAREQKHATH
jgi:hypothetical protein